MGMNPRKIEFYIYAENDQEVKDVEQALYNFVDDYRKEGVVVTAQKIKTALDKFKSNFFVKQFLR